MTQDVLVAFVAAAILLAAIGVAAYALWILRQVLEELQRMNSSLTESLNMAHRLGAVEERLRRSEERQGQLGHDLNMGLQKVRGEMSALSDEIVSVGIREAAG